MSCLLTMSSVDRGSLLRASSMSSPKLSMKREVTPPTMSDPTLVNIHDRLNHLDAKVLELRTTVLTKDAYVDRRNREDEFIRREFVSQREVTGCIDANVVRARTDVNQLKTDISQLKAEILQLRTHVMQLGSKEAFVNHDMSQLKSDVEQLRMDVQQLQTDVCATRTDLSQIQSIVSQLRIDLMTLQRDTSQGFGEVFSRFSAVESRMKYADQLRFNQLANTAHAPIRPVPVIDNDGTLRWPSYFPRTVWKFWCLKKRNRLHRLVELAEFYELEDYQYWSRPQTTYDDDAMSDSSDSSDRPSDLTRAEAARQFPEMCHQALAATIGLAYSVIRNEIGELPHHPHAHMIPSGGHKRQQDELTSINSAKPKSAKISRRQSHDHISPNRFLNLRLDTNSGGGRSVDSKSLVSEGLDKLGWNANASEISDEAMSKLRGLVSDEVNTILLRAVEQGRIKLKPGLMDRAARTSPTSESANMSIRGRQPHQDQHSVADEAVSVGHTVPTELISPLSAKDDPAWIPETMSDASESP